MKQSVHDPDRGPALDQFELRDVDAGDLLGIFMGVHAVPGVVMLLHTTVGCKFKTQLQIADHDWGRESHNQRLWTGVDDARIIKGSGERLVEFGTTWYQRRKPELFVVTTNASVELSAFDVESAVEELRARLPIPVIYMKAPGHAGSLFNGYKRFTAEMMAQLDPPSRNGSNSVAVGGYLFDRYEMEHAANITELRRLLTSCGMSWSGLLFDGSPLSRVRHVGTSENFVWLPYGHGVSDAVPRDGRKHVETDLPVGLTGTSVFLDRIGSAFGLDADAVAQFRERELTRVVPLIRRAANMLSGSRIAVFLDTPAAAAVVSYLAELDCEVPVVFLTDGPEASVDRFFETCQRLGAPFAPGQGGRAPVVHAGLSRNAQHDLFMKECARSFIPVVIGSSQQKWAFKGDIRFIEMGYPAAEKHWLYPMPWMGYNGAVALAQRLMDATTRTW